MANNSIWIIDDDYQDHEIVEDVCKDLQLTQPIEYFETARDFLRRLNDVKEAPFLILCDIKLHGTNGLELRRMLLESEEKKYHSVPFIIWSEVESEQDIEKAYRLRSHGFFIKPPSYGEWKSLLRSIIEYWSKCKMPAKAAGFDQPLAF